MPDSLLFLFPKIGLEISPLWQVIVTCAHYQSHKSGMDVSNKWHADNNKEQIDFFGVLYITQYCFAYQTICRDGDGLVRTCGSKLA